jgi:hypothetical protein
MVGGGMLGALIGTNDLRRCCQHMTTPHPSGGSLAATILPDEYPHLQLK